MLSTHKNIILSRNYENFTIRRYIRTHFVISTRVPQNAAAVGTQCSAAKSASAAATCTRARPMSHTTGSLRYTSTRSTLARNSASDGKCVRPAAAQTIRESNKCSCWQQVRPSDSDAVLQLRESSLYILRTLLFSGLAPFALKSESCHS